jgi:dienelactone hydrolase
MDKKTFFVVLLVVGTLLLSACASSVKIKGVTTVPGKEVLLNGTLYKPKGDGPFPAVVLLHRCGGIRDWDHDWASRLQSWGYVSLILDSFGPRGIVEACSRGAKSISLMDRGLDAHSGKSYLEGLPFVDPKRIAVVGWSYGGRTALSAIDTQLTKFLPSEKKDPFRAAVAFYPDCSTLGHASLNAPLLILIGEKDDWTSAGVCSMNKPPEGESQHEVSLKIYPGAYHCFDCMGAKDFGGHHIEFDQKATSDSIEQVRNFLLKHLK